MSCRLIFVKFENVSGGAAGYYDLVDSQNRVLFENLSSSELETGMTFSVDNQEIQFRLANFRLDGDSNPCQTSTTTTTTTTGLLLFTPQYLQTKFWYDADDLSTISKTGTDVTQWNSKGNNTVRNYNATPKTGGLYPQYTASGLNGKPVITFNLNPLRSIDTWNDVRGDVAVVFSRSNMNQPVIEHPTNGIANFRGMIGFVHPGFTFTEYYAHNGGDLTYAAPQQLSGMYYGMTAQSTVFGDFAIGIGEGNPGFADLNGYIAEAMMMNKTLVMADRYRVEGYLAHKWGLASSLPVGHPYKSSPPVHNPITWTQLCDTVNIVQDSQGRIIKRTGSGLGEWANVLVSNQTASGPFTIEFIKDFNETAPNMNIGITSKTTCSSPSYNTIDYGWFSVRPFNSNISPWYNNAFNSGPVYVDGKIYKIVFDGTNIEWYYDNILITTQLFTGTLPVKLAITQSQGSVEFLNIVGFMPEQTTTTTSTTTSTTTGGVYTFNNVGYESGPCDAKDSSNRTVYSSCSTIQAGCVIYENDSLTTLLTGTIFIYIPSQSQIFDINPSTGVIIGLASFQC